MKARMSASTTRLRIDQISDRTTATVLPKVEDVYLRAEDIDQSLTKTIVDKMIFSEYPSAKYDGTSALTAFLMNTGNVGELKEAGSLGAVLELLRRADIENKARSEHVYNLTKSLCALTLQKDGTLDRNVLERFLSNPHAIPILLTLCKHMSGELQDATVTILLAISKSKIGITTLTKAPMKLIDTLLSPELTYNKGTAVFVRHTAASLLNRLTSARPDLFPADQFMELVLDANGKRRITGYMEMQILNAFCAHLSWLESRKSELDSVFLLFRHFISELKTESFESLDHMRLIVQACVYASKDPKQLAYMLQNELNVALQYLVRTDFSLHRRKAEKGSQSASKKTKEVKYKRLSVQDTGERPTRTLLALLLVQPPEGGAKSDNNLEDVNFFATESAIKIFENIMVLSEEIIGEITTSGLLPALLFRVGNGSERDLRYNKLAVSFMHAIIMKLSLAVRDKNSVLVPKMPLTDLRERSSKESVGVYGRHGEVVRYASELERLDHQTKMIIAMNESADQIQMNDMKSMSKTLHSQGVTALFYSNLTGDDADTMRKAVTCLSLMHFSVISEVMVSVESIIRLSFLATNRPDTYFPVLSLLSDILLSDPSEEILDAMLEEKTMKIILSSLKLSGWLFHCKSVVYRAVSKLADRPIFIKQVHEVKGMSALLTELKVKKKAKKSSMRKALAMAEGDEDDENDEDDGTAILYVTLHKELCCLKVQNIIRGFLGRCKAKLAKSRRR